MTPRKQARERERERERGRERESGRVQEFRFRDLLSRGLGLRRRVEGLF